SAIRRLPRRPSAGGVGPLRPDRVAGGRRDPPPAPAHPPFDLREPPARGHRRHPRRDALGRPALLAPRQRGDDPLPPRGLHASLLARTDAHALLLRRAPPAPRPLRTDPPSHGSRHVATRRHAG